MNLSSRANRIFFNGNINIIEVIKGPLELVVTVNKCDQDMKKCEKLPPQVFKHICSRLRDTKTFYYGALSKVNPPIECPVQPQKYKADNSTVNLTPLTYLPMEGFIWMTTTKFFGGENRKVALCLESTLSTIKMESRRRRPK